MSDEAQTDPVAQGLARSRRLGKSGLALLAAEYLAELSKKADAGAVWPENQIARRTAMFNSSDLHIYMRGEFSMGKTPDIPGLSEQNSYVPYPADGSAEKAVAQIKLAFRNYVRDTILSRIPTATVESATRSASDIDEIHDALCGKEEAAAAAWRATVASRMAFKALSEYQGISVVEEEALRQTWLAALREEERLAQIALSKEM